MKKKTIKKLRLDKIKVASLSTTQITARDTAIVTRDTLISGPLTVCGASICICSWPTEDC
ncbi:hypothetical protein [uncultured Chitinophaga sp.]|uniref:hypothetical protein n=1 Tax=uncultured Chitinophaga sp. TaxID=339340 RepID=UPI00261AFE26|nr:hypothetical protein [uncultured Chitinophaga sp.]